MNSKTEIPYEMHAQGSGGFVSFETDETAALPLFSLGHAVLRGDGGRVLSLEFPHHRVVVEGQRLAELFQHLLAGRVRIVRRGRHSECVVERIQLVDLQQ